MRLGGFALAATLGGCGMAPGTPNPPNPKEVPMSESRSPSGDIHPGEITFDDQTTGKKWTESAADKPETLVWVDVGDSWEAVTLIVITGEPGHRRITKFGKDGEMLETTIQGPPPPAPAPVEDDLPVPSY